jgi:hypothetical protein
LKAEILAKKTKAQTSGICDPLKSMVAYIPKVMEISRLWLIPSERTGKGSFQLPVRKILTQGEVMGSVECPERASKPKINIFLTIVS